MFVVRCSSYVVKCSLSIVLKFVRCSLFAFVAKGAVFVVCCLSCVR